LTSFTEDCGIATYL